jgi:hypothetical protein
MLLDSTVLVECIGSHQGLHIGVDHITHFLLLTLRFQKPSSWRLSICCYWKAERGFHLPVGKESASFFNT